PATLTLNDGFHVKVCVYHEEEGRDHGDVFQSHVVRYFNHQGLRFRVSAFLPRGKYTWCESTREHILVDH
ncbi:MAG: hypothetical protein ACE5HJ_09555, partial [Thermoplasmata archaeon]